MQKKPVAWAVVRDGAIEATFSNRDEAHEWREGPCTVMPLFFGESSAFDADDIVTRDIVTRLRKTRADMIGTSDEDHYWDCQDAAAYIEASRFCRGRDQWRLTADERDAIRAAADSLRRLLDSDGGWR